MTAKKSAKKKDSKRSTPVIAEDPVVEAPPIPPIQGFEEPAEEMIAIPDEIIKAPVVEAPVDNTPQPSPGWVLEQARLKAVAAASRAAERQAKIDARRPKPEPSPNWIRENS